MGGSVFEADFGIGGFFFVISDLERNYTAIVNENEGIMETIMEKYETKVYFVKRYEFYIFQ